MEYLDNIITRLALKCVGASTSGYGGPFTVDSDIITVDSDIITVDQDEI
jgi:hypothetical protein